MKTLLVESCPLCGGGDSAPFDQRQFQSMPVANRLCTRCGLVFQSPRMPDDELASFYEHEYRQLYQGSQGPNAKDLAVQQGRAASLLAFVTAHIPGPANSVGPNSIGPNSIGHHLDIGCSAGLLLQAFQSTYASQPVGIEPGEAYREYARQQNLTVFDSLEALASSPLYTAPVVSAGPRFDLVSLAHVLEHLPDPVSYLAGLRTEWLAENGWLLVEVPNLYAHDSFEVAHLVSYSPHTLAQTLYKAGYEMIVLEQHGRPRSALLPLYLTALARPAVQLSPFSVSPEKGVRRKRQWGMLRRRLLTRLFPGRAWLKAGRQGTAGRQGE